MATSGCGTAWVGVQLQCGRPAGRQGCSVAYLNHHSVLLLWVGHLQGRPKGAVIAAQLACRWRPRPPGGGRHQALSCARARWHCGKAWPAGTHLHAARTADAGVRNVAVAACGAGAEGRKLCGCPACAWQPAGRLPPHAAHGHSAVWTMPCRLTIGHLQHIPLYAPGPQAPPRPAWAHRFRWMCRR